MSSPFDDLDAELSATVLAAYGETCHIYPRRAGTYSAPGTDAERKRGVALVVLSESPGLDGIAGARRGTEMQGGTRLGVTDAEMWMSRAQADELGSKLAKGDLVAFPARQQNYSVVSVMVTQMGDIRALLAREGAE